MLIIVNWVLQKHTQYVKITSASIMQYTLMKAVM